MRAPNMREIEAGIVTFPFFTRGEYVRMGTILSRDVLAKMPINNRNSLIDKGYINPVLKEARKAFGPEPDVKRFIMSRGPGRFDVIEGRIVNDKPVDKETAYEMAGIPVPEDKKA